MRCVTRVLVLFLALSLAAQMVTAATPKTVGALTQYADPNSAALFDVFVSEGRAFRWAQFGDSHTAGEYFTGELRSLMQKRFGDGGPGWLYPGYVRQQRFEAAKLSNLPSWELTVSRANSLAGGAAGGVEGTALKAGAAYAIGFKQALPQGSYIFKALLQPSGLNPSGEALLRVATAGNEAVLRTDINAAPQSWQVLASIHNNPTQDWIVSSPAAQSHRLAGAWVDFASSEQVALGKYGASLDALGINGAKAETAASWDAASLAAWLQERQPTVVAFEYGTNEALDPQFSSSKFSAALTELIHAVRRNSSAVVLLISPPDLYMPPKRTVRQTVKLANGKKKIVSKKVSLKVACDAALPPSYQAVHHALRTIAAKEKTLYWDWQAAMGGRCAMRAAAQETPPLAQPDGVHLTAEGYVTYARLLWADLLTLERQRP